ncbi:hypothetical protein D3C79_585790 [compost metagenome]
MQVAVGFRHVDTLVDRGDIGRAGERPNDAAGAKNRQATQNAQARVHGFQRQAFAVLHIYRDFKTAVVRTRFGKLLQVFGHHPPWHRVDCRFAHRQDQTGTGHGTHACAGDKAHAGFSLQAHATVEQGTMGDIRVVTGILEGAGFGTVRMQATELQAHLHLLALGQGDLHGVALGTGQQQACCGKTGGSGAAAGGQAAAQGRGLFLGLVTHQRV